MTTPIVDTLHVLDNRVHWDLTSPVTPHLGSVIDDIVDKDLRKELLGEYQRRCTQLVDKFNFELAHELESDVTTEATRLLVQHPTPTTLEGANTYLTMLWMHQKFRIVDYTRLRPRETSHSEPLTLTETTTRSITVCHFKWPNIHGECFDYESDISLLPIPIYPIQAIQDCCSAPNTDLKLENVGNDNLLGIASGLVIEANQLKVDVTLTELGRAELLNQPQLTLRPYGAALHADGPGDNITTAKFTQFIALAATMSSTD